MINTREEFYTGIVLSFVAGCFLGWMFFEALNTLK